MKISIRDGVVRISDGIVLTPGSHGLEIDKPEAEPRLEIISLLVIRYRDGWPFRLALKLLVWDARRMDRSNYTPVVRYDDGTTV